MTDNITPLDTEDESAEYNFQELLDVLNECRDIILTVPSEQVQELKDGLQAKKSKTNYAMRQKNIEPPAEMLHFNVYPATDAAGSKIEGQTCVRITLRPRKSVDILKMEFPSSDL